jgi:hypothetical protein
VIPAQRVSEFGPKLPNFPKLVLRKINDLAFPKLKFGKSLGETYTNGIFWFIIRWLEAFLSLGGFMAPYYVGGSSAPCVARSVPPYVGQQPTLARAGRRRPFEPTTNVELNRQPGRLGMAAIPYTEASRRQNLALVASDPSGNVILALDLGQKAGWAARNADGAIVSGTVEFRPGRFEGGGMVFLRFRAWLQEVDETAGGVGTVYFEEVRSHRGVAAAHAYGGFLAHLTAWAEANKIPYRGVPVATIKRHVTGKGNADKEAVIAAVQALGFDPADDNEADALALLDWVLKTGGAR